MANSAGHSRVDDVTQQRLPVNGLIMVQRRHHTASPDNTWTGGPRPSTRYASLPTTRQQPLNVDDIVAVVHQHGREDPWDGIGIFQAQPTTAANWYDPRQSQYQYQTSGNDRGAQWDTAPGAEYFGSTQADHGSQRSEEQQESSDHAKDAKSDRKPRSHSSRKHIPSRRS
ncbi:hypothetical protein BKA56DRAFT_609025 [Ilyonectria sp. MPI-CAGE-AT-0026]|nr:hypothetical protein BKA56DRAFT_609025 [Ilyonectria sp. MPI-CAGE-AT-0026]